MFLRTFIHILFKELNFLFFTFLVFVICFRLKNSNSWNFTKTRVNFSFVSAVGNVKMYNNLKGGIMSDTNSISSELELLTPWMSGPSCKSSLAKNRLFICRHKNWCRKLSVNKLTLHINWLFKNTHFEKASMF